MTRPQVRYFEEYRPGAVYEAGHIQLSEAEIVEFGRRYDPQALHVDLEAASASAFGGLIASGWQTAAVTMRLLINHVFGTRAGLGSPGVDELRWLRPVRPGDTLAPRVSILEARPSRSKPDRGIVRFRVEVENQRGELAMSMVGTAFIARRPRPSKPRDA